GLMSPLKVLFPGHGWRSCWTNTTPVSARPDARHRAAVMTINRLARRPGHYPQGRWARGTCVGGQGESAGVAGVATRAVPGGPCWGVRAARRGAAAGPDRGQVLSVQDGDGQVALQGAAAS